MKKKQQSKKRQKVWDQDQSQAKNRVKLTK